MSQGRLGERAIVLGAGIAGTLVARVLADHFARVTVLERDGEPDADGFRKGVPQAKLIHGLLRSGVDSMEALFPGFEAELYASGAVRCKPARDVLFVDQMGHWPRPDVGFEIPFVSRPVVERGLRNALARVPNVELRDATTVQELIADGERVVGVRCRNEHGTVGNELAELVVDATGSATHTIEWLRRLGFATPVETRVEVHTAYAGCFVRPRRDPGLHGVVVGEPPPHGRYRCLIQAQEGDRMIVAMAARGKDTPLADDYAGLLALAERLPHSGPFELLRDCEPLSPIARFGFPASVHRHYERLERVPAGFLCIGDAICSFNPVWGQGMSVAALEVSALGRLLMEREQDGGSLASLPAAFYAEAARIIATPWQLSVAPDFAFDTTRGERPAGLGAGRGFSRALSTLAMQEPEVRALLNDVYHLLKPLDALMSPAIRAKVAPLLAAS